MSNLSSESGSAPPLSGREAIKIDPFMDRQQSMESAPSDPEAPSWDDMKLFIGANADKFQKSWASLNERGLATLSWCWPGFLAPLPWFLYRKLYSWAAFAIITPIVIELVIPSKNSHSAGYAVAIMGGFGKRFYVMRAKKIIKRIRTNSSDDNAAAVKITKAGGTSIPGAIIGAIVMVAVIAVVINGITK